MQGSDRFRQSSITEALFYANDLVSKGKLSAAAKIAEKAVLQYPINAHTWHLLSNISSRRGAWQVAYQHAERALSLCPDDPGILLQYGQCLIALGRRSEALNVADRVAAITPERPDWNDALGTLLTYCEEPARALVFFERATRGAPDKSLYLYILATAQRMTGDLVGAESTLDHVIALQPDDVRAYYTRTDLRTQTDDRNHIEEMERLLLRDLVGPQQEIMLCFAIAKELEDIGRYGQSFEYLKRGCDHQRRRIKYNVRDDIATIDRLIELHDRTAIACETGFETDECIFVIGLPRSGTSLVERILSNHSAVQAAGELNAFAAVSVQAVQERLGRNVDKREFVRRALEIDPAVLGRAYLAATRTKTGHSPRFVDKTPTNYLYAGLIRRSLPQARIVALVREPLDSCYAMYKTLFAGAYPFSYELSDLGRYYAAWHRLMFHWQSVLGDRLLIIQYEDLVTDPEAVAKVVLEHCRLTWEDACLGLYKEGAAVSTASAAQVRRPIYTTSVGLARHYHQELEPLAQTLRQLEPPTGWRLSSSAIGL
jgi:tetratricopeptide (TPR) repeat protein